MSKKNAVEPRLGQQHAAVVAALIQARTAGFGLDDTPLALLPDFARKLLKASKRRRRESGDAIQLTTLSRAEAVAGFHYLALFNHPDVPADFLTSAEAAAVQGVAVALAASLLAKRGPQRLDRSVAERRVAATEADPEAKDRRWRQRLKRRNTREDDLNATAARSIPPFVKALLAPKNSP